jgi:hypothetical protein
MTKRKLLEVLKDVPDETEVLLNYEDIELVECSPCRGAVNLIVFGQQNCAEQQDCADPERWDADPDRQTLYVHPAYTQPCYDAEALDIRAVFEAKVFERLQQSDG